MSRCNLPSLCHFRIFECQSLDQSTVVIRCHRRTYYNNERYHESLDNITPGDVYLGQYEIITERDRIKKRTMRKRKREQLAAKAA